MAEATTEPVWLQHYRVRLALHCLRGDGHGHGHPLLLLHGLGERRHGPGPCGGWTSPATGAPACLPAGATRPRC